MAYKFDRYHRDYLYWIYPFIILVILIFAILRDKHHRETVSSSNSKSGADSSVISKVQDRVVDSTFSFYAATK